MKKNQQIFIKQVLQIMLTIAFHVLNLQVIKEIYNYAYYNELLLKNKSVIIHNVNLSLTEDVFEKFNQFKIIKFTDQVELETKLIENECDAVYYLCEGNKMNYAEMYIHPTIPLLVHCFGLMPKPFGDVYVATNNHISEQWYQGADVNCKIDKFPVVSNQIVDPTSTTFNYREQYGIPISARVFGQIGNENEFNILFVFECIFKLVQTYEDVHFLFAPLTQFHIVHPRIHYLSLPINTEERQKFINTCDAMIHGKQQGDALSFACMEFQLSNKPVITFPGYNQMYLTTLQSPIIYHNFDELFKICTEFKKPSVGNKSDARKIDENSPEKIMKQFDQIFLNVLIKHIL